MKQYICEYCGKSFGRRGKDIPRFCSMACHDNARRKYVDIPCDECGKLFLPNHKDHRYCSLECGRKGASKTLSQKVSLTCEHCGATYERSPSQVSKYCSPECYFKAKQATPERSCDYCGKTYQPRSDRANYGFCSRECSDNQQSRLSSEWRRRTCPHCGDSFRANTRDQQYCSPTCANTAKRTSAYGQRRRTKLFSPQQKAKMQKRDGDRCVLCGGTENLEADHILAVGLGGSNRVDNGQTLCHECHRQKTARDKALIRKLKRLSR